jgi:hypothetical protein
MTSEIRAEASGCGYEMLHYQVVPSLSSRGPVTPTSGTRVWLPPSGVLDLASGPQLSEPKIYSRAELTSEYVTPMVAPQW